MEIKESDLKAALAAGGKSGKSILRTIFPDEKRGDDNRPVTERIKTFEDAVEALGEDNHLVIEYRAIDYIGGCLCDIEAEMKLRIICAALNDGWEPQFTLDELRYVPVHILYTDEELANKSDDWKRDHCLIPTGNYVTEYAGLAYEDSTNVPSDSTAHFCSRLCLKDYKLAKFCGKQFIELWADFWLIRR